jgi:diacylglycerol kinase (ATP)
MADFLKSRIKAFKYAFSGLWIVLHTQKNAWIHSIISLAVIILAIWLQLPGKDWAILILTIALVWGAEIINTSIETIINLASPEQHPLARDGKDLGAAAVLVAAMASVIIGLLILGTPLWKRLAQLFSH